MLYTSGTTGRPKGVPRSHRAERAAALAQLVQLELRPGDRTLGVMPLYHTMGMRSLLAASACGGVFCSQPEFRAGGRARRRGARAADLALPRADALPRPRRGAARAAARRLERARARLRGRAHDGRARRALRRGVRARGVRQPLRLDRDLHVHDPRRSARQAGLRRARRAERAHPARRARCQGASPDAEVVAPGEVGQVACALSSDEAFAGLLEAARRRRAPDQGRLVLPRRPRAARRRRRPLPRRPHRRHDRLGRRERASARDRGVARAPSRRRRGRRRGRARRAPRPARRRLRRRRRAS